MAFVIPSGNNTYIPSWEATTMIVSATRDSSKFPLAKYIQYVPTTERTFKYLKLDLDEPARITSSQDYAWAPGQDAPMQNNIGAFQFITAQTVKYAYAWCLPDEAIDQAVWDLESSELGIIQQKAMTNRTILMAAVAQTTSSWPTSNVASASTLNAGAGLWSTASADPASANYLAIKKSLVKAATIIVLQTNAVIKWADQNLIVSPGLANIMGNTSEVYSVTVGAQNDAFGRQKGESKFQGMYGLPTDGIYGISVVVEDAVRVTTKANAITGYATSGARSFVWADANPCLLSRKGGIEGKFGGNALSTLQMYHYRDMETYTKNDVDQERQLARVVDDIVFVLPFGQSGFSITGAV